jgi:TPP-dependent 2-oxoacid decarboxylase
MTGSELSAAVRYGQAPIVVVLNNRGYSTEREILEGPSMTFMTGIMSGSAILSAEEWG